MWNIRSSLNLSYNLVILQEGAPLALAGHQQDIEHLATDGHLILSHCLAGRYHNQPCAVNVVTDSTIYLG